MFHCTILIIHKSPHALSQASATRLVSDVYARTLARLRLAITDTLENRCFHARTHLQHVIRYERLRGAEQAINISCHCFNIGDTIEWQILRNYISLRKRVSGKHGIDKSRRYFSDKRIRVYAPRTVDRWQKEKFTAGPGWLVLILLIREYRPVGMHFVYRKIGHTNHASRYIECLRGPIRIDWV